MVFPKLIPLQLVWVFDSTKKNLIQLVISLPGTSPPWCRAIEIGWWREKNTKECEWAYRSRV